MATNTTKLTLFFQKWSWLVSFIITYFCAKPEIFSLVLFGLVLYYYFQYPTRKFLSSTEFSEYREFQYKISNSGIPNSFLGLRRDGKWPVLNGQELDGTGSGWSWVLRMGNFPDFLEKWHSGMQTSTSPFPLKNALKFNHQKWSCDKS